MRSGEPVRARVALSHAPMVVPPKIFQDAMGMWGSRAAMAMTMMTMAMTMLMVMMIYKFFYVAAWFMHLRFDSPLFTKFFVTGLVLATIVYGIALTVFEFWHKG